MTKLEALSPLSVPKRIAFAGDWHGSRSWAVRAVEYAAEQGADVIVHAGDFGYFQPAYLPGVTSALAAADMHLLFVDGNHEHHRWLLWQQLDAEGLRPLTGRIHHLPRGFRWTWDGVRFVALGGAHSVDGIWRRRDGDLWQPEERITDGQAAQVAADGQANVLISHDCPAGFDIPGLPPPGTFPEIEILRAEEHRRILRGVVDAVRPRMIWHGHYHSAYTRVVDFGWGAINVAGLDRDGTSMDRNMDVVPLEAIKAVVDRWAPV